MSWSDYDDENKPVVREDENGNPVLDDPTARGMIEAVSKHNCRLTYEAQLERVDHFARRMDLPGRDVNELCIVLLNVDDPHGGALAELLMPGHDWQPYRDRGEVPFARGLAGRQGIQDILSSFDIAAAVKVSELKDKLITVVVDHGTAEVFDYK
jgi:hypothetical protein